MEASIEVWANQTPYSPDRPSNRQKHIKLSHNTVLRRSTLLHCAIHTCFLISLSFDSPYRSTLTMPHVACSQTHIPRPIILPPENASNHHSILCNLVHSTTLTPFYLISQSSDILTVSFNIDHTAYSACSQTHIFFNRPFNHRKHNHQTSLNTVLLEPFGPRLHTSTLSMYRPTDHIGQHWPYHI